MKKIFLFLFAALLTGNVWADSFNYRMVDAVPEVGHYTWYHSFDPQTNNLTFYDKFSLGVGANRKYVVHVYSRKPGKSSIIKAYRATDPSDNKYYYGTIAPDWICVNEIGTVELINEYDLWEIDDEGHTGGEVSINLNSVITKAKEQNYTELHIAIEELTRPHWDYVSEWYPVETESRSDRGRGLFHNNCIDVDLPVVQRCYTIVTKHNVNYGENFQITGHFQGAHAGRLTIQYQDQGDTVWNALSQRTITAQEAKDGYEFTYKRVLTQNGYPASRKYRLCFYDPIRGRRTYSNNNDIDVVRFYYKLESPTNNISYKMPGDTISLSTAPAGKKYFITSDIPVEIREENNQMFFIMPACNVRLQLVDNIYTVQFRDYDNTILKTEKVACGSNATPPTPPTHAGMTFTGWDKPYTDIRANQVIQARYKYEGIEAELTCTSAIAKQGENITFNVRVKTPTSIATRAFLDAAWIDDETDEVNFGSAVSTVDFSKEEAAEGTTKSLNVTVLPTGVNNYGHRARYFRLRIRFSGSTQDYYFNIARIETYYPITINTGKYEDLWAMTESQAIIGNGTIYARPGDSIWFVDTNDDMCEMSVNLANGWSEAARGSETTDEGVVWSYIVMPTGYGANAIDVSHKKHTVLFYAEGHFDGYWRTVYGDGVYEPQEVLCGNATTPPDVNDIPNKIFRGWKARGDYADDAYTDVTDDMIFDAILEDVQTFTVTFKDWDGTVLSTEEVAIGESASAPAIIEGREGFDFVGWDKDFSKVTEAMTVTAQYEAWAEGIEQPSSDSSLKGRANKVLRDGVLYIERNGTLYNAQGAEVK